MRAASFDELRMSGRVNQLRPFDRSNPALLDCPRGLSATMCEFCSKYGHRNRWYLNPENFSDELLRDKGRQKIIDQVVGWGVDYYIGRSSRLVPLAKMPLLGGLAKAYVNRTTPTQHAGQIVPLEDALKMVDLARDFVALPCMCRRLVGGRADMTCLNFGPIKELTANRRPEEPMEELPPKEVKARLRQFDKMGYVHQVAYAKLPYPIVICNCDRKYCTLLKFRFLYDLEIACLKGHDICMVDQARCDGCSGKPECVRFCQFGALRRVPTDGTVVCEPRNCFGCGVCRQSCPRGALRLIPRESLAPVREVW
jgi:NAD-dependent dihydropyrimidine dehydrogenase PreA subunit